MLHEILGHFLAIHVQHARAPFAQTCVLGLGHLAYRGIELGPSLGLEDGVRQPGRDDQAGPLAVPGRHAAGGGRTGCARGESEHKRSLCRRHWKIWSSLNSAVRRHPPPGGLRTYTGQAGYTAAVRRSVSATEPSVRPRDQTSLSRPCQIAEAPGLLLGVPCNRPISPAFRPTSDLRLPPPRMASTMSGARQVRGRSRQT
jgi:hypothetical protein